MLTKRAVLLSKDESVYNTDSTPVGGTDAIFVEDPKWAFAGTRLEQRKGARASLAMLQPVYAGSLMAFSFKAEMKGSGAAGTAPEIAPLLRASGFAETISAGVSVTYKPSSTATVHKSETMYFYDDGLLVIVTGARGKVNFDLQVGQRGMANFDMTGHLVGVFTDAALPSATYDSPVPPPVIGGAFAIAAYSAIASKLAFDMGNEIALPGSISAADGFGEVQITGRNVTGSFDAQRVSVATHDFITKFKASTAMALATGTIGGTAGNKYAITMPAVVYTGIDRGDASGIGTYDNKFQAAESTGDDEVSIVYT